MSIVLQSSGGGSVTLQEADTASNLTITVPAVTGTMLTDKYVGTVLQVVNAQSTTGTSTTSATMVTTGLSASITPKFSTSKIFAQFQFRSQTSASGVNNAYAIYRGATNLTGTTGYGLRGASSEIATVLNLFWMDSPSTTSSTTYTLYFSAPLGGTNQINPNNSADFPISITLMEISA
jgi:hypothetical protein